MSSRVAEETPRLSFGTILLRILCVLIVTVLLIGVLLYSVMFVICKGPSETARNLGVRTARETSAMYWLPNLFLTDEEISAIEKTQEITVEETDTSLVSVKTEQKPAEGHYTDEWGYTDDDDDGIILVNVPGQTYTGYMMIVLDPSRVVLGCNTATIGGRGYTVAEYISMFDAVAGINGGGFDDPNGKGNGGMPDSAIVGIDNNNILHVGFTSLEELTQRHIRDGCGYGPILVSNGKAADDSTLVSGLNPRTAIGQRTDGAILMLVIDGRQPNSLGATYADEAEIMLRFGAVNAMNLDGGSSSLMWFQGKYINNNASVIGIRPIPTSFVVLKEGARG